MENPDKEKDTFFLTGKVSRVEVIDDNGRSYVYRGNLASRVELQLQDEGRTLKVFIQSSVKRRREL
jgi:hypothetical protein